MEQTSSLRNDPGVKEGRIKVREEVQAEEKEGGNQEEANILKKSGDEEVNGNQAMYDDDMADENDGNSEDREENDVREEDDEYFPDEDSIGSEEEATSDLSDEDYTPTFNRTTVKSPKMELVTAQLLVQGGELSEYEKIRAANIKQKEEFLRTLQGDWHEFKKSEGLVAAGQSKDRGKKLESVQREAVITRASAAKSCPFKDASAKRSVNQPASQVSKKRGKTMNKSTAVLVKCQECGEEVRKSLLGTHNKFYHPKIKIQKPKAGNIATFAGMGIRNDQVNCTWKEQGRPNIDVNVPAASGEKVHTFVAPSSEVGGGKNAQRRCVVDSLFANIKVSPASSLHQKSHLSNLRQSKSIVPGSSQPVMVSPHASNAKQTVAFLKAFPPASTPLISAPRVDHSASSVDLNGPLTIMKDRVNPKHLEDYSVSERAEQKTQCMLCGEMVPAGLKFFQLHQELYHFQVGLSG